jgi:3'-phosphoadenosine 5'-phosphosulfate sulfotransferase (PAPS reductase)/FAD synthetase
MRERSRILFGMDNVIDLTSYDLIVINTSGGKDSSALMANVIERAEAQGVRDRVVLVHAVLAEEWGGTLELVERHAAQYDLPLYLAHANRSLLAAVEKRGMWPSRNARYCTSDHKRGPIEVVIRRLSKERGAKRVLNCLGIRSAESPARAKKKPFETNKRITIAARQVDTWYPIFDWSVKDVWAAIAKASIEIHPAYKLGMPRLSCMFCVFAPKAALMLAGRENPVLLQQYVDLEKKIGHSFTKNLSIAAVQAAIQNNEPAGAISTWEM